MRLTPIVVIGAGPAGSAAARQLALLGHDVVLIDRPPFAKRALAESIPPSTHRVLAALGIADVVRDAAFQSWTGNHVWWGAGPGRSETFAGTAGYQVDRARFDTVLKEAAGQAGAQIRQALVREVTFTEGAATTIRLDDGTIDAPFVIDASGRAGVVARDAGGRRPASPLHTIAVAGSGVRGRWPVEASRTLVASYADGWAWSVATDDRHRQFTVMVDPARSALARDTAPRDVYLREIAKVTPLAEMLTMASLVDGPWGADASQYDASIYATSQFLLTGDAASFIDPLSSVGVKKALASGWLAATVVNTLLRTPSMTQAALAFYNRRERDVFTAARGQAAAYLRDAAAGREMPFWHSRAASAAAPDVWSELDGRALADDADVQAAFHDLRVRERVQLRLSDDVRIVSAPLIRGHEIVLDEHLLVRDSPDGVRYLRGIDLLSLARAATSHTDAGAICEAVMRTQPDAALPDILGALSFLIARGILRH